MAALYTEDPANPCIVLEPPLTSHPLCTIREEHNIAHPTHYAIAAEFIGMLFTQHRASLGNAPGLLPGAMFLSH